MKTYLAREERNIFSLRHIMVYTIIGGGEVKHLLDAEGIVLGGIEVVHVFRLNC